MTCATLYSYSIRKVDLRAFRMGWDWSFGHMPYGELSSYYLFGTMVKFHLFRSPLEDASYYVSPPVPILRRFRFLASPIEGSTQAYSSHAPRPRRVDQPP